MKTILYYVTDHGLGHASRSVAIIRELQKKNVRIVLRNSNNIDFLQNSLPGIEIIPGVTDVGPTISEDGISIDQDKSKINLKDWIGRMDDSVKKEKKLITKLNADLVISDISPVPIAAASDAKKNSLAISNFCWSDVLPFLESDELSRLDLAYEKADLAIKLPFGTDMKPFKTKKTVGIVCKKPTRTKKEICDKLKIDEDKTTIFVNLGKQYDVSFQHTKNTQIISTGASTIPTSNLILPWTEGQDLISVSDLVICKLGYGMVTECLTNETPFVYLSDTSHIEQQHIANELIELGFENDISSDDLRYLDLEKIYKQKISTQKFENKTNEAIKLVSEFL